MTMLMTLLTVTVTYYFSTSVRHDSPTPMDVLMSFICVVILIWSICRTTIELGNGELL